MVVDGGINDQPGPYTIRLSFSSPIDTAEFKPYSRCQVSVMDDEGTSEAFLEVEAGVYKSNANGMQGMPGKRYKLIIHTPSDQTYESTYEKLLVSEKLDSVYANIEYRQDESLTHDLQGYQFYLDTEVASKDTSLFLWRLEETYHYQSDFTIRWYFDGTLEWFHGPDSLMNCWRTLPVNEFYTMSTANYSTPKIEDYALHYVNTQTRKLSVKYSLLVRQYTLNQNGYAFWDALSEQNSNASSLYATQPYYIKGNVQNVLDPNEPVLGYFLVAGLDEKRIFVDRPKYPVKLYYSVCMLSEADFEAYGMRHMADPVSYPLYAIETNGGRRAIPPKGCTDCRTKGGTITKPDFWED